MRFIGSKERLLEYLDRVVLDLVDNETGVFADLFAGTTVVSKHFKRKGFGIISNDTLFFSYVMQKTYIENNSKITFDNLLLEQMVIEKTKPSVSEGALSYLNSLEGKKGFCHENYSPGGSFGRQYLTEQNAVRIDEIRDKIDEWFESERITESERYYLICALIEAIPFVSNISGTYGSYLKKWDKRAFKKIELNSPKLILSKSECFSFQRDANDLIKDIECDVLYIDPPYNNRQYISNYHLLETISRNDKPILKGKTGTRDDSKELSSKYCKRQEAIMAFTDLLSKAVKRVGHVVISYNSEGIIPIDNIEDMIKKIGFVGVQRLEIPFTRFKSNSNGKQPREIQEYIFVGRGSFGKYSSISISKNDSYIKQLCFENFETSNQKTTSETKKQQKYSEAFFPECINEKELETLLKKEVGTNNLDRAKQVFGEMIKECYSELVKKLRNQKRLDILDETKPKTPFFDVYDQEDIDSLPSWLRRQIDACLISGSSKKVVTTPEGKKYHMNNRLNDLDGAKWTFFLNSVLVTRYSTTGSESYAHEIRKIHPSPKPPQLMKEIIDFFTKEKEIVLDYFMGVGGSLIGASLSDRRAIGIDLNEAFIDAYKTANKALGLNEQTTLVGDSLEIMERPNGKLSKIIDKNSLGMILIDPPYANMMSRKKTGNSAKRRNNSAATPYTESTNDLGNLEYDEFLDRLRISVERALYYLKNKRYLVVFAKDLQPQKKKTNIIHADIIRELNKVPNLYYSGMKIWADYNIGLYPYGYPYSFVANQVHQYILVFQKRD